jgi:hypothetical protein
VFASRDAGRVHHAGARSAVVSLLGAAAGAMLEAQLEKWAFVAHISTG